MSTCLSRRYACVLLAILLLFATAEALAQSTATLQGTVMDESGAVVPNADVTVTNLATNLQRSTRTDSSGAYLIPALPVGTYRIEVSAPALERQTIPGLKLEVSRTLVENFRLKPATVEQSMTITSEAPVIERGTMTVGEVIDEHTVQEIPLNGRHFVDLASLAAGTVVPPIQNAFLTAPLRGQGSFAIISAGNREDTTNFMINGINLNDMANGQITFQPSINTVSEFKIDNSTPSAEYGRNSGPVVNIATRSGTNDWHGEAFDFLRNEDLDARNFFNKAEDLTGKHIPKNSFKRNQFGGALGGPIWKDHTFFFFSYEGLRQRQGLALSTNVPTDAQRAAATNPTVTQLFTLLPHGEGGGPLFQGAAVAPVNIDQWTGDLSHNFSSADRLHGYYVFQRDLRKEPTLDGGNVPGAGDTRQSRRQIFTLNESHVFSPSLVNELRLGFNRIHITFLPDNKLDPTSLGIADGLSGPIGIPQIQVTSLGLIFGGISGFPQGRGDYTAVLSDSASYLRGRHSLKFGGEYRRFLGNSFGLDDGFLTFATATDFINAKPNGFLISVGDNVARTTQQAIGLFGQDSFKLRPYFTVELGLRWEWNMSPTEARNRSSIFLPASDTLVPVGTNGVQDAYRQNDHLFEPRVGFAWDMFHNGNTVLRGGYGIMYDQPLPGPFIQSGNPPFVRPVQFVGSAAKPNTSFGTLLTDAAGGGLVLGTQDLRYQDANVQSWNLNLEHQITPTLGMMIGYFGSKGTHLNMDLNINQFVNGVRPFPKLAPTSPILPNGVLGNIVDNVSNGNSSYNSLWVTGTKRLSHGLQFNANYTWSKSIDENSRNFENVRVQNSFDPPADRALSDFDARHHFVVSAIYELPFQRNRAFQGWRLTTAIAIQSGNPLNVFAGNPATGAGVISFTGTRGPGVAPSNLRPDLIGPLPSVGTTLITSGSQAGNIQWFPSNIVCDPTVAGSCNSTSAFAIPVQVVGGKNVYHFGSLGRNALIGPNFRNVDFGISKTTKITERLSHEIRLDAFDLFNHPNFSNPGTVAQFNSPRFGVINATRAPTGDAGSSRQLQFAMKLIF